ncbi:hypothetical protein BD410DRAFT_294557 [Rickenella mellea]|uniref:Uncharacterized protein n=1 Tax=Rickenella mellea TaxID=50990 RepID=A0A4Y7Q310_9AGAM|nr:hypothetical protein BD410DRAFT_294557 [Rickenella mellea]
MGVNVGKRWMVLALAALAGAQAQTTNATCLSTFDFLNNSKGQSPCLVAAYVAGACNGGQYDVSALDVGEHYIGPSTSLVNNCQCSSIFYSLMSACGVCQNRTIITWTSWHANCKNIYLTVYPENIPSGTAIPAWAYADVSVLNVFDPNVTLVLKSSPDSTSSFNPATQTGAGPSPSPSNPTHVDSTSTKSSNIGAIAGGGVGGVVLIALLALIAFLLIRQRKSNRKNMMEARQYVVVHGGHQHTEEYNAAQMTAGPLHTVSSHRPHDPFDPPTSPSTPAPPTFVSHATEPPPYADGPAGPDAPRAHRVARLKSVTQA